MRHAPCNPAPTSLGGAADLLTEQQVTEFVTARLGESDLAGRSVCVLVPDTTRTCPLPLLLGAVQQALHGVVSRLTVLVALGTHAAPSEAALAAHLGDTTGVTVITHEWWDPATFATVGSISADRVAELSAGRLSQRVDVRVNRAVVEHDVTLVLGPVFPHEVVGFSGGNKYLFPGVSGPELIDLSHWLGALITSASLIGTTGTTPVRAMIDEAAALVPSHRLAICVVTAGDSGLHSVTFGTPEDAWALAADASAQTHVRYLDAPVRRVLSVIPAKYDDLWTGAKGFYKVEPVVADGGEVVLYAPHIREISGTHPAIGEIGYHCRDYFVKQWDRFRDVHWSDLAHSTHLRGAGTYDAVTGEQSRVTVTLATGIPQAVVHRVGLRYLDPACVDIAAWYADPSALVVPDAGEDLYRLAEPGEKGLTSAL